MLPTHQLTQNHNLFIFEGGTFQAADAEPPTNLTSPLANQDQPSGSRPAEAGLQSEAARGGIRLDASFMIRRASASAPVRPEDRTNALELFRLLMSTYAQVENANENQSGGVALNKVRNYDHYLGLGHIRD